MRSCFLWLESRLKMRAREVREDGSWYCSMFLCLSFRVLPGSSCSMNSITGPRSGSGPATLRMMVYPSPNLHAHTEHSRRETHYLTGLNRIELVFISGCTHGVLPFLNCTDGGHAQLYIDMCSHSIFCPLIQGLIYYLFFKCCTLPRHRNLPLTMMAMRVHRASHSSILKQTKERETFQRLHPACIHR